MIRKILDKVFFLIYGGLLLAGLTGVGLYFTYSRDLPQLPDDLEKINLSLPTEIYSWDGERIMIIGERQPVSIENISPNFLKAILAVEDRRFYSHHGLDHRGFLRAMFVNLRAGRWIEGGSTITQQLSKNLFFSFERKFVRKFKEFLIASQLEATFDKDQILEAYCNQIYFGSGAYGVEEASRVYFAKRAKELTLLQAAILAGLPKSPKGANPFTNFERSMARAKLVLSRMERQKFITAEQKEEALNSELGLVTPKKKSDPNLYFANFVIDKLEKDYGKEFVHYGGLKIYTTLDSRYQRFALKAAQSHLEGLEEGIVPRDAPLQTAVVAIENKSGAVRAMLGGRNYSLSQFNRAISSNRLPGSSFKPLVYLTAMEVLDYSPATVVKDEPYFIEIPGTAAWEPKNFGDIYAGDIILKKALMRSINVVSAKLIEKVTPQKVVETGRKFGIKSHLGANMSLALGTSGVSPLEMASAYSMIASLGVYNEPFFIEKIEDFHGNQLYQHYYQGVQRYSQELMYPLVDMMQGVVDAGTGRTVRRMGFKHPAGGKTGTTNDFKDAWFNGFTKDLSVSVWVGYDNNDPMIDRNGRGLTGGRAAVPIWVFFMQKALQGKKQVKFPVPTGIKFVEVDVQTGRQPDYSAIESMRVAVKEELDLSPLPEEEPDEDLLQEFPQEATGIFSFPASSDGGGIP